MGGAGSQMKGQVSMQDLCKQQLEENLARERQQQTQQHSFNMRSFHPKDAEAMSPPGEYRARNGSPLRKV